jgi:uncharacterized membrane protein
MKLKKTGKISPIVIGIFSFVIIGAGIATILVIRNQQFSSLDPLPVESYFSGPKNMIGNQYSLDAVIDSQVAWKEGTGKIMTIKPITASTLRIPVFLPDNLPGGLHVGQRYRMQIAIDQRGLIKVEAMEKY